MEVKFLFALLYNYQCLVILDHTNLGFVVFNSLFEAYALYCLEASPLGEEKPQGRL